MHAVTDRTFGGLIESLDQDPHSRGKQFEKIVKWWLTQDPLLSRDIKKVWLWNEWPGRTGSDIGIDLVAEMFDGSLTAIQAKCFDPVRDIPKSELDSFISAASPRKFAHRLLVASTDGLSSNARRTLDDNQVVKVMRSDLEASFDVWPTTFSSLGGAATILKSRPLPHQAIAINDVVAGLQKTSRGQLIMACGTGKTLTSLWITEQLDSSSTLVLVPSLSLLSQTLLEWARHSNTTWSYLCVCSDDTVNKSDDQMVSTTADLPFDVTTKPADIAAFLSKRGRKIIFSTYQSSGQVSKGQKKAGKKFDLVIADEAHRLTGKNDADFATVLDGSKIATKKLLFMTATPRTYTESVKTKASERGVEITSMDDEIIFGKELHKLSFGQAIEQDLLTDYRVVIVGVTDPQVQELIERRELVSVAGRVETDARTLAAHIGLAKATKDYDLKRTISFHGRIKSAQQFAQNHASVVEWMPDGHKPSGTIWADTITGAMNSSDRRKLLDKLKEDVPRQHALLSNARCLTEGIDVPSLDGVAFIDPRSSQVDIIQAVGRAIRKADNKTLGTIVLPVLIPDDADTEHALEDTAFKPIWAILNALRSHDEQFANHLDQLRTELGRTSRLGVLPDRIIESLPADIDTLIPDFSHRLSLTLVERSTNNWDFMFGQLLRFVDENGHARPIARKVKRSWFEQWVADQRVKYKRSALTKERIRKLESLPGWTWDPLGDLWNKFYDLTIQFSLEFGHAAVPTKPILYRGERLASWINTQRTDFNKGILDDDSIKNLELIHGWTWDPKDDNFERVFEVLRQFVNREGTARVVSSHFEFLDGKKINLGSWCTTRRGDYYRGWLTREKILRFEALPDWSWNPIEDSWETWFQKLVEFGRKNGHHLVPKGTKSNRSGQNESLGSWVNTQRTRYKKGKLENTRRDRLEALQGWSWSPFDNAWDSMLSKVLEIAHQLGSIDKFREQDSESQLIKGWINAQRHKYKDGALSDDRANQLQSVPGWSWEIRNVHVQAWETSIKYLRDYVAIHSQIPSRSRSIENFKLGEWVKERRVEYNSGQLSADRILELESIPGWTWDPFSDAWNTTFNSLQVIADSSPLGLPPIFSDKSLSTWITRQRKLYGNGNLSADRISLLKTIKGWQWKNTDIKNDQWKEMYTHLVEFVQTNGHARVRDKAIISGIKLGTWVAVQRRRYYEKTITTEQITLLEGLKKWSWKPIEDDWQEFYNEALRFASINAGKFPQRQNEGEIELAQWIGVQRTAFKARKVSETRVQMLEQIPGWLWEARNDVIREASWDESFMAVTNYLKTAGTLKAPKSRRVDGIAIASWISIQRKKYYLSQLETDQIKRLEGLKGWAWDVFGESWNDGFMTLLTYVEREGHALVPLHHREGEHGLGPWVNGQRTSHMKGNLEPERINKLEKVKGWTWAPKQDRWEEYYAYTARYTLIHGHARIPDAYRVNDKQVGKWVGKQRQAKKNGTLSKKRIKQLEALKGWVWKA